MYTIATLDPETGKRYGDESGAQLAVSHHHLVGLVATVLVGGLWTLL